MRLTICVVSLAAAVAACGASNAGTPAHNCDVGYPSATQRARAAAWVKRFDAHVARANASVKQMQRRDDGSRHVHPAQLRRWQRARTAEGLDASANATRAVALGSPASLRAMHFPLTTAEGNLLYASGSIGDYAGLAQRYASRCLHASYAGVYQGGDARGPFFAIALTTDSVAARTGVLKRSAIDPRLLRIVHVRHTLAELTDTKERIARDLEATPEFGSVGVSESNNRVDLGIQPFSEARAAQLRRHYGAILHVTEGGGIKLDAASS